MLLRFREKDCKLSTSMYGNRKLAIVVVDIGADAILCVATANYPGVEALIHAEEFLVYNDGVEEGALFALEKAGYVKRTGKVLMLPTARSAHVCITGNNLTVEP